MYIFIHVYAVRLAPSLSVSLPLPHPLPSPLAFPIYLIYYNKGLCAPYNFFSFETIPLETFNSRDESLFYNVLFLKKLDV